MARPLRPTPTLELNGHRKSSKSPFILNGPSLPFNGLAISGMKKLFFGFPYSYFSPLKILREKPFFRSKKEPNGIDSSITQNFNIL